MSLPENVISLINSWSERGLPLGFYPWPEGDVMLWGYVESITGTEIRFRLIGTQGEFDEVKSYSLSRIWEFDFDPIYARRLVELSKHKWKESTGRIARSAAERDRALQSALESGDPINIKKNGDNRRSYVVRGIFGSWILLANLDELERDLHGGQTELVLKSKMKVYVQGNPEPDAYLRKLALSEGSK